MLWVLTEAPWLLGLLSLTADSQQATGSQALLKMSGWTLFWSWHQLSNPTSDIKPLEGNSSASHSVYISLVVPTPWPKGPHCHRGVSCSNMELASNQHLRHRFKEERRLKSNRRAATCGVQGQAGSRGQVRDAERGWQVSGLDQVRGQATHWTSSE